MIIKLGKMVSHAGAIEWGVGKVTEVTPLRTTIQFSDGITRKISISHYNSLQPADPASFVPTPDIAKVVKVRATPRKKVKEPIAV